MVAKPNILIVDDEQVVRESLYDWFALGEYSVDMAATASEALDKLRDCKRDILLTDIKMPGMDGLELQRRVKEIDPEIAIVMMTAYASVETATQAIKEGAYDYVIKPIDPETLEQIVNRAAERQGLLRENLQLKERIEVVSGGQEEIIGESTEIRKIRELIRSVASTDSSVLITGERGTGKELVARSIHRESPRRHMPFVIVKRATLSEDQIERELFGWEESTHGGEGNRCKGRLELATGGAVFFDDLEHIPSKIQLELVRALEDRKVTRLGGSTSFPIDFRFLGAAQGDLLQAVESAAFQRELFERINACSIALPPLRERSSDIPLLASYFLDRLAGDIGAERTCLSAPAMQALTNYEWPGNVRELKSVIERAAIARRDKEIRAHDLVLELAEDAEV